jgi:hypothetical protein
LAYTIDLSAIAASFPSLEILSCPETTNLSGSLEQLGRLQILRISAFANAAPANWLPLRSARILTEFSLEFGPNVDTFFDPNSLGAFVNLKSLNIRTLIERLCDFLIATRIQLHVFEATLIRRHARINKVVQMLHTDCLRNLKEFGVSNFGDNTEDHHALEQYWSHICDAFTSILSSVEEVQLFAPLYLKCCEYCARMSNLKILNWDRSPYPHFGCGPRNPKA